MDNTNKSLIIASKRYLALWCERSFLYIWSDDTFSPVIVKTHYNDVTWMSRKLSCFFDTFFFQDNLKENINHVALLPLCPWWRHQMEAFSALLAICAGNSPVSGEFPTQKPVTRSFDVCFDLRPNKRLSKHSWGWWFETLSSPLWRHRNVGEICRWIPLTKTQQCSKHFYCMASLYFKQFITMTS